MYTMFLVRAALSRHSILIANGLQRNVLYGWRRKLPRMLPWQRGVQLMLSVVPFGVLTLNAKENSKKHSNVIAHADELFDSNKMTELLEYLKSYQDSDSAGVQWRLARAYYKVSNLSTTARVDAERLAYKAMEHITKALELDNDSFACHEWAGIVITHIGNFEGSKKKVQNAYVIRDHFVRAIELNPANATCRHLLGQWCFSVAEIPWYLRQVVSAIFATPPSSTYEEALGHFQKAEELEPEFYSTNWLYLGKTYLKLGQKEEAKEWLQKTVAFDGAFAGDEEDKQAKAEAKKLLSGL